MPPDNGDLKYGRVEDKSDVALKINQKSDNIRGRIDTIYEDMLKNEGFVTAQKLKLGFLGLGFMEDSLLKVFKKHNEDFGKIVAKGERSDNTYYKYKVVNNHLTNSIKERHHREDMTFRELTSDFIREFDFYLRIDKGCSHNTVCTRLLIKKPYPFTILSMTGYIHGHDNHKPLLALI